MMTVDQTRIDELREISKQPIRAEVDGVSGARERTLDQAKLDDWACAREAANQPKKTAWNHSVFCPPGTV